jgi:hypothetical protein
MIVDDKELVSYSLFLIALIIVSTLQKHPG